MRLSIRCLLLVLAILGVAAAASAQDSQDPEQLLDDQDTDHFNEVHVWIGQWMPDADSDFWADNFRNFEASRSQLDGFTFGGDFIDHLNRHNALMLSGSFYWNSINEPARNVLDESGNPLEHHLDLATIALTASYVLYPVGTEDPVIPYLGAGAGLYVGQLRGYRSSFTTDDCDEEDNCTTTTEFVDSNDSFFLTLGYFVVAGLEVPVTPHSALLVEGRYTVAHANLRGDFEDNGHLDLSGAQFTAGLAIRF
jgi:opacity protein-like surface antigen